MQLGFFTMPIHPLDKDWRASLREDREAFILAGELGFTEAYCGEHSTDAAENITSSAMFLECIQQVLEIWRSKPPYDIGGKYWNVSTAQTLMPEIGQGVLPKPLQRPHPPIITTVVSPHSPSAVQAGEQGWDIISANFLLPQWVKTHWPKYQEGCATRGHTADPAHWRVAKSVFVADDAATARDYALGAGSPYRFYYSQLLAKMLKAGRAVIFKPNPNLPDDSVTLDDVCERLVIHGTPDSVADQIFAFREEVGPFGTMLYAGHDWRDPPLARRSMVLMAEKVLPLVNAAA